MATNLQVFSWSYRRRRFAACDCWKQYSGVARPSAARGRPWKCRPFHPTNVLTRIFNDRSCFVSISRYKDEQSILKTTIKQSQTEMCGFHYRLLYETCFFCLPLPSSSLLFLFSVGNDCNLLLYLTIKYDFENFVGETARFPPPGCGPDR